MKVMTALRALARTPLGSTAQARPAATTGTDPVAPTDAQIDQVTGGGSLKGGIIFDSKGSLTLNAGGRNNGGSVDF